MLVCYPYIISDMKQIGWFAYGLYIYPERREKMKNFKNTGIRNLLRNADANFYCWFTSFLRNSTACFLYEYFFISKMNL